MSIYQEKLKQARASDLSNKAFLTDFEAAAYLSIGRTAFREFAREIGCRKKIGRRVLNDRAVIDAALRRGDAT